MLSQEGLALGEERYACDVITARDMSSTTLRLITTRADEIAAVVLNPLQGLLRAAGGHKCDTNPLSHPAGSSAGEVGDPSTHSARKAGGDAEPSTLPPSGAGASSAFGEWLHRLRATCTVSRVPLILDESATGFRLALGGAQEYFGVNADVVCYGKTLGGGLPLGVVCGASWLMEDSEPHLPLRAGTGGIARGGMACNAGMMRRTRRFLEEVSWGYTGVRAWRIWEKKNSFPVTLHRSCQALCLPGPSCRR
jgi:glutamate-1-semialdehyde 2,1-aminomutase